MYLSLLVWERHKRGWDVWKLSHFSFPLMQVDNNMWNINLFYAFYVKFSVWNAKNSTMIFFSKYITCIVPVINDNIIYMWLITHQMVEPVMMLSWESRILINFSLKSFQLICVNKTKNLKSNKRNWKKRKTAETYDESRKDNERIREILSSVVYFIIHDYFWNF